MIEGRCLCGAAGWTLHGEPEDTTVCNCSACRRYGAVWAYGHVGELLALTGPTTAFSKPDHPYLAFRFCGTCGSVLAWVGLHEEPDGRTRMAVNLRLALEPAEVRDLELKHFEGAASFEDVVPEDPGVARHVRDLWF